ncbi:Enhancer of rudimentary [Orchesella cincta]|uniref:Enhancer of rudimentary n=1 Tax=Orchesella cincta TaxID=48709 RepID=A0A1D2NK67_ORCCI|nr:Enhancer of rudimentary [Orchesella cincta]
MACQAVYHEVILLIQPLADPCSRRYWTYNSVNACMEGLCRIFEQYLKWRSGNDSNVVTVRYEIADILNFIDSLPDLACVVGNFCHSALENLNSFVTSRKRRSNGQFIPCAKAWIKEKVYLHLYEQAHRHS